MNSDKPSSNLELSRRSWLAGVTSGCVSVPLLGQNNRLNAESEISDDASLEDKIKLWSDRALYSMLKSRFTIAISAGSKDSYRIGRQVRRYSMALYLAHRATGNDIFINTLGAIAHTLFKTKGEWSNKDIKTHNNMSDLDSHACVAFLLFVLRYHMNYRKEWLPVYKYWRGWKRHNEKDGTSIWTPGRGSWNKLTHVVGRQLLMAFSLSQIPGYGEYKDSYSNLSRFMNNRFVPHPQLGKDAVAWMHHRTILDGWQRTVYAQDVGVTVALINKIDPKNPMLKEPMLRKVANTFSFVFDLDKWDFPNCWRTIAKNRPEVQENNSNYKWDKLWCKKSEGKFWGLSSLARYENDKNVISRCADYFYENTKDKEHGFLTAAGYLSAITDS